MLPAINEATRTAAPGQRADSRREVRRIRRLLRPLGEPGARSCGGSAHPAGRHRRHHGGPRVLRRRAHPRAPRQGSGDRRSRVRDGRLVQGVRVQVRDARSARIRVPGNVAGGLLNITIKSLGAIAKAGTTRVEGCCGYAEVPVGQGAVADAGARLRPGVDARPRRRGLAAGGLHHRSRHDDRECDRAGREARVEHAGAPAHVARSRPLRRRDHRRHRHHRGCRRARVRARHPRRVRARCSRRPRRASTASSRSGPSSRCRCETAPCRLQAAGYRLRACLAPAGLTRSDTVPCLRASLCLQPAAWSPQPVLMRAAVLVDVGRIELRDIPVVAPGRHDVRVRVTAVGLCGTDFHIFGGHANYHTDHRGVPVPLSAAPPGARPRDRRRRRGVRRRRVADLRPGDSRGRRSGHQLPQCAPADLRVLRLGRFAPVRLVPGARHHGPPGRAGGAHHGARRERHRRHRRVRRARTWPSPSRSAASCTRPTWCRGHMPAMP